MNLSTPLRWFLLAGIVITAMGLQAGVFANPSAPVVRHGAAEFNFDNPGQLLIQQGSDKLIVDWGEFNISAGELTQFIQPGSGSAALNRVMSALPSSIQGQLQANGRLILINPNGVLIGPGGRIDTAGFIASTLDVSDADFLAGGDLHFQGDSLAKVVNLGTVNAIDGGDIFLIAREVVNAGTLNATEGTVGLAAGQQVVIAAQGEERVAILPEGQEGSVTNSGTIQAATAELKAAGGNEYALAVNNTGLVRAKGFEKRGGRIYLSAGGGKGRIVNTGTLKARMEDNSGGLVQITHAGEMEGAGVDIGGEIDVKGDVGSGGMVLVNAPGIHVLEGARIDASGKVNGGQIALHSAGDEGTMIDGQLLADGASGDGGFIHVTGSFIGLGSTGVISANGGNGGGFVLLGADPEDGGSGQVESSQIVLAPGSRISANGMRGDGGMVLINGARDSNVILGGEISASSDAGVGGQVMAFGGNISLGSTAMIDASGYRGGGQVYIGGGPRGRDAGKPNAQNTNVATGAQILANATGAGDGGMVILWANQVMDFQGSIENMGAGGGAGGFAEVSGLEHLGFYGTVDTGGGNLLLDPYNYIIGAVEAANLVAALGLGNVTIDTTTDVAGYGSSGNVLDPGNITVNSGILYDSTFDLTFLAMGDALFNASVQNSNAAGGDVNVVAGWDGMTAYNTATFVAEDVNSTTVFGNSVGSVYIGDGTQAAGVAVGSRSGTTNVFGYDVGLQGGTGAGADWRFAQLGFQVSNRGAGYVVDGGITVHAKHDVSASGGDTSDYNYVQIGHVGGDQAPGGTIEATATSVIEMSAGNDVSFSGGAGATSYAQLGQGGLFARGNHRGTTTITQANDVSFSGGAGVWSYAQLGQGGHDANGSHSGTTTITQANDVSFSAGAGVVSYAQLGQGGYAANGNHSGTTTLVQVNDVSFSGGPIATIGAYTQLGQGGLFADGNHRGTTTITQANDVSFSGGTGVWTYAQLGQGGHGAVGSHSGTTTITQANDVSFSGGTQASAYAQLGQGGYQADGSHSGNISLTHTGNLQLTGVDVSDQYALIGHGDEPGDGDAGFTVSGDVMVRTGGNATLNNAWIGHLLDADGPSNTGNMSLSADGNINLSNNVNIGSYDSVFDYSYIAGGNVNFDSSVQNRSATGGDVNVVAGWNGMTAYNTAAFVAVDVNSTTVFGNSMGSVNIGDGTQAAGVAVGSRSGMTNVFGYDVGLQGGTGAGADGRFAQLGFQVSDLGAGYVVDGDIIVHATHDVAASGGGMDFSYAQIGHVGADQVSDGTIEATATSVIELSVGNDMSFSGGTGNFAYAQLGQGGLDADGNHSGTTTVTQVNDVSFSGGAGSRSYAQLGQGGAHADGNHSGTMTITQANDVSFSGGYLLSYAQLGQGGAYAYGNHSGTMTITQANDVSFSGGTELAAYAQLGQGGFSAVGSHSGTTTITQANDVSFSGGTRDFSYAQLGQGGYWADGSHSGSISLTHAGNLQLTGMDVSDQYVLIGHGDDPGDSDAFQTVSGDVMVLTGGNTTLVNAFIGHLIDANGTYASGNTYIGAVGDLGADAASQFNSAPNGSGGELRIYLLGADNVNAGTLLNGVAHGATVFPNNQGTYLFGQGPYAPPGPVNPVAGNFAYYTLAPLYNYEVDTLAEVGAIRAALEGGSDVTLTYNLGQMNFGAVYDIDGGTQYIHFDESLLYDANQDLNLFATGDALFNASVQNSNAVGGDVNVVAGWDGMAAYNTAAFVAEDVNSTTVFGNSMGSVHIGDGTQAAGVAVGSRSGMTNVFGYDVSLQGGTGAGVDGRFAQLGFQVTDQGAAYVVNGGMTVHAKHDLVASGGDTNDYTYAQIGHVGADQIFDSTIEATATSVIELSVGNNVNFTGGAGFKTYAQLGQGGYEADGDHSGTTTITQANDVSFTGGAGARAYAQLGQGGYDALGNHSGTTTITQANDVSFTGGGGGGAYAQLGQGGYDADGNHSGTTTLTQANDVSFTGGAGARAYAQLGQGGYAADGNHSGSISLTHAGNLQLTGVDVTDQYALIGHGDDLGDGDAGNTVSGDVTVRTGGNAILNNAWIGHLLDVDGASNTGYMSLSADGNISLSNSLNMGSYDSASGYSYIAGGNVIFNASVQNSNDTGGDTNIVAGWDGVTAYNTAAFVAEDVNSTSVFGGGMGSVIIGDGTQVGGVAVGSRSGNTNVFGYDVSLQGGQGAGAVGRFAQLGFQVTDQGAAYVVNGGITVHVKHDLVASGGDTSDYTYAQIGHVGADLVVDGTIEATATSLIELSAGSDVSFTGGVGDEAYAQLGQGGANVTGNHSGTTTITQANDVIFTGGAGFKAYVQLGQGGYEADGDHSGTTTITQANDVSFTGGAGARAYAQLGQGGYDALGNHSGTTTITQANDVSFTGGVVGGAYAQLGQGGYDADGNHSGTTTLTQANDVSFTGGAGARAYAQLGQGGYAADGNHSGSISLTHAGNLQLTGVDVTDQYSLIGHGDDPSDGDAGNTVSGDVAIRTGGNTTLTNAFIGHLIDSDGTYASGNTFIGAGGDLTADAASTFNSAPGGVGVGELRLYVGGNDNVDTNTLLNGTFHGGLAFPNNQGAFLYGTGPYVPAMGNFAYYTLPAFYNYTVDTLAEATAIQMALNGGSDVTLTYNLNQANYGAHYDWDGGTQFIRFDSELFYDSTNTLNLLATGDALFNASVQNSNVTGGDINVVAGWDGMTAYNTGAFVAEDVSSTTVFSGSMGSVHIGDGMQAAGVAVGSRSGNTNVFAYDVSLQGGMGAGVDGRFAHLGYQVSDAGAAYVVDGGITVHAKNDVSAIGGDTSNYNYVQIGHVGADQVFDGTIEATATSVMELSAGNNLSFNGGAGSNSYAQMGQGGFSSYGDHSGTTTITQANDIMFNGGIGIQAYAQLGQGGWSAVGNHSGTTTATQANDVSFSGGVGFRAYAQLGQGGDRAFGNHSGTTTVTQANDVNFIGGAGDFSYAQLGQGGYAADGNHSGTTMLGQTNDMNFSGGAGDFSYSQLGQGGFDADGNHSGTTTLTQANDVSFIGGGGSSAYAQLGQGGWAAFGDHSGTTTVTQANDVSFSGGAGDFSYSQLGQGGFSAIGDHSGTTTFVITNNVSFLGGVGANSYVQLGQGGADAIGNHGGTTALAQANNVSFIGGIGSDAYAQLGQGGYRADGDHSGNTTITLSNDMIFTGGTGIAAYAQLGQGGYSAIGDHSGTMTVTQANDVSFSGGAGFRAYAQLGQGGERAFGNHSGITTLIQANDVSFSGGAGSFSYSQLGQGGYGADGSHHGVTMLRQVNDVNFSGGTGDFSYAQLGQGGYDTDGSHRGTATLTQSNNVSFSGGAGLQAYAQLGQGGFAADGNHSGTTMLEQTNDVSFGGGIGDFSYAQLGQGGLGAFGNHNGTATLMQVNDVNFSGGIGSDAYVQLGQGGQGANGSHYGVTRLTQINDVNFFGGGGDRSYAQLGQGGYAAVGDHGGNMTITLSNDINFFGGGGFQAYAQLGQGGYAADGNHSGTTTLAQINDVRFSGGAGSNTYAQLGQGGERAFGNHSGTMTLMQANDVNFTGGAGSFSYSQLGQGGFAADGTHSGITTLTQANNVNFSGGAGDFSYSQLGQGGFDADGSHGGTTMLTQSNNVSFSGGAGSFSYSQLGQGGFAADGNHSGTTTLAQTNDVSFGGGIGSFSYAQLGQGGLGAFGNHNGTTTLMQANDVNFSGGIGADAYVQLGQGGQGANGAHSGVTMLTQTNDVNFFGGGGDRSYAQLGQGGYAADGSHSGMTTLRLSNDINFFGGGGSQAYAQLGQGGYAADGNHSGTTTLAQVNDVTFSGGAGPNTYAQLGQGGFAVNGNHSGNISLAHAGNLQLTGVDVTDQYALIGHGDEPGDGDAGFTVRGNVMVRTGGNTTLTNAFIGHLIDPDGSYAGGNTFIGTGSIAGPELLTADANSGFFSSPVGQLRFYIPDPASNQVAAGASFNGTPAPGLGITPNAQGNYAFGFGPYNLIDPGNFAFYTLAPIPPASPAFSILGGRSLQDPDVVPTGMDLPLFFREDIRFIRPKVFEKDSWLQWYDYGIEGFVDFLPNGSMYTLGSFEVDPDETNEEAPVADNDE